MQKLAEMFRDMVPEQQKKSRKKFFRGFFTLLELLIVVAVIAILAGLLLPALNAARGKAMSGKCASNLKMLLQGGILYAQDQDGWWVPNQPITGSSHGIWQYNVFFKHQLNIPAGGFFKKELLCPESDAVLNVRNAELSDDGTRDGNRSYTYPWILSNWQACDAYKLHKILSPSVKMYWGDGLSPCFGNWNPSADYYENGGERWVPEGGQGAFAWRHSKKINTSFFDGHASFMTEGTWNSMPLSDRYKLLTKMYTR